MAFDPNTAALADVPAFDAASAQVVDDDGFSPDSAQEVDDSQPLLDILKRIPAGIAKASADAAVGVSRIGKAIENINPTTAILTAIPGVKKIYDDIGKAGQEYVADLGASAADAYGVDESRNQTIPSKLVAGASSIVPAIASGPLAPLAIGGMMGEQSRQEARATQEALGNTNEEFIKEQENTAFVGGVTVGALSELLLGVPALIRSARAAKIPDATFKAIAKVSAQQALKGAGREGVQEGLDQIGQNLVANTIAGYDPERKTFHGVPEAVAFGAVIGAPVGGTVQAAASIDAIRAQTRAEATQVDQAISEVAAAEPPPLPSAETTGGVPVQDVAAEAPARAVTEPVIVESEQDGIRTEEIFQPGDTEPSTVVRGTTDANSEQLKAITESGAKLDTFDPTTGSFQVTLQGDEGSGVQSTIYIRPDSTPEQIAQQIADKRQQMLEPSIDTPEKLEAFLAQQAAPLSQATATEQTASTPQGSASAGATAGTGASSQLSAAQLEERIGLLLQKHRDAPDNATRSQIWTNELEPLMQQLKDAEGQSMGPGAASSAETLTDYALRRFGVRFGEDERMAPELREAAGNRFYEVLPNRVTAAEATEIVDRMGEDRAERLIRDEKSDTPFAVRATVGQILIQRLNQQYQAQKAAGDPAATDTLNKAADAAEWLMDYGTRLGQGVQSFAMWMRLSADGKLASLKKGIRKAKEIHRQRNQQEVDEVLDTLNTDRSVQEKEKDIGRLGRKNRVARRIRKKVKELAKQKQTTESFYDIAAKELGLPDMTPEQEGRLRELAARVDSAADGMPKFDRSVEFFREMMKTKGFESADFLLAYYYGNILSGGGTQVVNAVDTFLNVIHDVNTLVAANPKAAATIYSGLARGFNKGRADAVMALSKGRKISDGLMPGSMGVAEMSRFGEEGGVPLQVKGWMTAAAKRVLESPVAAPLNAYKYVFRGMSAADAVNFRGAQEARAGLLAFRIATDEGLTSAQRTKRVNEILGWDRVDDFMQRAEEEGFKGQEQVARATELMIMQRPEGLQNDSSEFAAATTYNDDPKGLLGRIANGINSVASKFPSLRLVVPFTKIVANVFNRRLDNLPPVALYRIRQGYYGTPEGDKAALVRMAMSLTMMGGLAALQQAGVLEITGQGPDDPERLKQLKQSGWRPYSIKIGDRYYSYASSPISLGLGLMGNALDWSKYRKPSDDEDFIDATTYAAAGMASYLFSQSFVSGLATFFDAVRGRSEGDIRRFFANIASAGVPLSGALKDLDALFSDVKREAKTMKTAVLANIPFARFKGRPELNAFGEPVETGRIRPLVRFSNKENKDPAWRFVADKGLKIPVPDPFFKTNDQNYEYQKQAGREVKQWILDNRSSLETKSTKDAQKELTKAARNIREQIRTRLAFKDDSFRKKVRE